MSRERILATAHLRIARPTDNLESISRFYCEGLGFDLLSEFHDHDGFDGIMLGHAGMAYHLEFTKKAGHLAGLSPTEENLLVFYLPDTNEWNSAIERMKRSGYEPVISFNPYWDKNGVTFADPDGYRVVLQNTLWKTTDS